MIISWLSSLKLLVQQNSWESTSPANGLLYIGNQALVVRKVGNDIPWINHYPADSVVCFVDHWIAIYPMDSVIQPSNNLGQFITV